MMKDKKEKIMLPLWLVLATVAVIATICFESLGKTSFRDTGIIIGTIASCAAWSRLSEIRKFPKNQVIRRFGRNYCVPAIVILLACKLISIYCDETIRKVLALIVSIAIIIITCRGALQSLNTSFPRWKQKIPDLLDDDNERSVSVLAMTYGIYALLIAGFLIGVWSMHTALTNSTTPVILEALFFPPVILMFVFSAYTKILEQRRKARLKSFSPTDRMKRIHSAAKQYIGYIDNALHDKNIRNIAITGDFGIGKSSLIKTYEKKKHRKFIHLSVSDLAEIKEGETPHDLTKADIEKNLLKRLLSICREKDIPMSRFQRVPETISKRYTIIAFLCAFAVLDVMIVFLEPFIRTINFIPDHWTLLQSFTSYVDANSVLHLAKALLFPMMFLFVLNLADVIIRHYKLPKISTKIVKGDSETTAEFNRRIEPENLDTNYMEIVYVLEQAAKKGSYVFVFEDMDRFDASVCVPILVKLRQFNEILNDRSSLKKRWFKGQKYTFIYVLRESIFEEYCNSSNLSDSFLNTSADLYKFCDIIIPVVPEMGAHNSTTYLKEVLQDYGSFNEKFLSAIAPNLVDYRRINDVTNEYKIFASVYRDELRTEKERTELLACVLFKVLYPSEYYQLRELGVYKDPAIELHDVLKREYDGVCYFSADQCIRFIGGSNEEIQKWKLKKVLDQIQDIMKKIDNREAQRIWSEFYVKEKLLPISTIPDAANMLTRIDCHLNDHSSIIQCFELLIKEQVDVEIAERYAGILVKVQQPTVKQVESVEKFAERYGTISLVEYYMQMAGKLIALRSESITEKGNIAYRVDNRATLRTMRRIFVKSLQKTTAAQSFAGAIWSVVQYENEEHQWEYTDMFRDDILRYNRYYELGNIRKLYGDCLFFILKNQETIKLQKKMKIIRRISSDWSIISLTDKEKEEYCDVLKTLIKPDPTSKNPLKRLADSVKNMIVDAELREEIMKEIERIEGEIGKSKNEKTDVEGTS